VNFLLDTNVVSEWVKPYPNPGVISWLASVDEDRVFLSVITLAELRYGIERMAPGSRRKRLAEWLEDELPMRFEERILSIDAATADACGQLVAKSEGAGRRLEAMDALLAATAAVHQLTMVTRNVQDFKSVIANLFNPWA
jgi:hypothetical protein